MLPSYWCVATGEVLATLLTVFMHQDTARMPLPGADEVLMCTQNSTAEEVRPSTTLTKHACNDVMKHNKDL